MSRLSSSGREKVNVEVMIFSGRVMNETSEDEFHVLLDGTAI